MKFVPAIAVAVASLIATACAAPARWTYGLDDAGPQHWGDLSPLYAKCKTGHKQSPIDLVAEKPSVRFVSRPIEYNYKVLRTATASWIKGFAVQVDLPQSTNLTDASWITLDGKRYDLINLHFHSPAEHRVNNQYYDAELHMVHRASDGAVAVAVIGIFYEVRRNDNSWFNWINSLDNAVDKAKPSDDGAKSMIKHKVKHLDLLTLSKYVAQVAKNTQGLGVNSGCYWNAPARTRSIGCVLNALTKFMKVKCR
ncbi:Carbonic anhydrase 1 [Mortierella alpina]|uniref:carbonic anhydrase n=1 Tax=Mortierella alpina TaxID=64518 RepID=A0A9P6J0U4_MORAP|nr:Carbonic anhydrase 1 [Mortierella alpina]